MKIDMKRFAFLLWGLFIIDSLEVSAQEYIKVFDDNNMDYYAYSQCDIDEYGNYLLWTKQVIKKAKLPVVRKRYIGKFKSQKYNTLSYIVQLFKYNLDKKKYCISSIVYYNNSGGVIKKFDPLYDEWEYIQPETYGDAFYEIAKTIVSSQNSSSQGVSNTNTGKVFDVVEQMPMFPGGQSAMMSWINVNIQYPKEAESNGIQGRVVCTLVVEPDGSVSDVQVTRSIEPSLDKEAIRVLQNMPKWIPGKQNGSVVRVKYTVPVTFRLQ